MSEFRVVTNGKIAIRFVQKDNGLLLNSISSDIKEPSRYDGFLPFALCADGKSCGSSSADSSIYKCDKDNFYMTDFKESDDGVTLSYKFDEYGITVETVFKFTNYGTGISCKSKIIAQKDFAFTDFYSVFPLVDYTNSENEDYTLSYRNNGWQAEGQWRTENLKTLGFIDYFKHPKLNKFVVLGKGSQTTSLYYPTMLLSSSKAKWLIEGDVESSWFCSLSEWQGWCQSKGVLVFSFGTTEERNLYSYRKIKAGETFSTPESLLFTVDSSKDIFQGVYEHKRNTETKLIQQPTVVFNDYMCCLWAKPTKNTEFALIDKAKELGADYYVIDDGWYAYEKDLGNRLGDWNVDGDKMGISLSSLIEKIRSVGLKAGIWFELEVAGENSYVCKNHNDWLLTLRNIPYGSPSRKFLDFRKEEVKNYLFSKIDALYNLGVKYYKFDYNDSYLTADSNSELYTGLEENYLAIRKFFDELYDKYQDIIIENCASGGKRSDRTMLTHFNLQSVSDQENYKLYPSIICGSLANNLPEKTGVWCLPCPIDFYHQEQKTVENVSDDEVVFNIVSGMTGVFTLSSRIDLMCDKHYEIVKEGIKAYKELFPILQTSYPTYPFGFTRVEDSQHALLMKGNKIEVLFLFATGKKEFSIDNADKYSPYFPKTMPSVVQKDKIVLDSDYKAQIFIKRG